jgi:hypothetical protein
MHLIFSALIVIVKGRLLILKFKILSPSNPIFKQMVNNHFS